MPKKTGIRFSTRMSTKSAPGKARPGRARASFHPMKGPKVRATRATPKG